MSEQLDPSAQAVLDAMREADLPPLETMPAPQARQAFRDRRGRRELKLLPIAGVEDRLVDTGATQVPVRIYRPEAEEPRPVIVYFHGGGWVVGDLDTHDTLCRVLTASSGMGVVAVDYRLAPEHPFPAAPQDAVAVTEWVAAEAGTLGFDPGWIGVAGDSAGGNLAAVVARDDRMHHVQRRRAPQGGRQRRQRRRAPAAGRHLKRRRRRWRGDGRLGAARL